MSDGQLVAEAIDRFSAAVTAAYASLTSAVSDQATTLFTVIILIAILVCALWKRQVRLDIIGGLAWGFFAFSQFDSSSLAGVMRMFVPGCVSLFMFTRIIDDAGKEGTR